MTETSSKADSAILARNGYKAWYTYRISPIQWVLELKEIWRRQESMCGAAVYVPEVVANYYVPA